MGAVIGGALGNAFKQPTPARARFAALELADQSLHEATKALSAHQPAKALTDINRAAKVLQSQGGTATVVTTVPATATQNAEQAAIVTLQEEVAALQADNQQLKQQLASAGTTVKKVSQVSTSTSTSRSTTSTTVAPPTSVPTTRYVAARHLSSYNRAPDDRAP